jgi:hypothetical protein
MIVKHHSKHRKLSGPRKARKDFNIVEWLEQNGFEDIDGDQNTVWGMTSHGPVRAEVLWRVSQERGEHLDCKIFKGNRELLHRDKPVESQKQLEGTLNSFLRSYNQYRGLVQKHGLQGVPLLLDGASKYKTLTQAKKDGEIGYWNGDAVRYMTGSEYLSAGVKCVAIGRKNCNQWMIDHDIESEKCLEFIYANRHDKEGEIYVIEGAKESKKGVRRYVANLLMNDFYAIYVWEASINISAYDLDKSWDSNFYDAFSGEIEYVKGSGDSIWSEEYDTERDAAEAAGQEFPDIEDWLSESDAFANDVAESLGMYYRDTFEDAKDGINVQFNSDHARLVE